MKPITPFITFGIPRAKVSVLEFARNRCRRPRFGTALSINLLVVLSAIPIMGLSNGCAALRRLRAGPVKPLIFAFDQSSPAKSDAELESIRTVMLARLERLQLNVAAVELDKTNRGHFRVTVPANADIEQIKNLLTYQGKLELKPVANDTEAPYATREPAEQALKNLPDSKNFGIVRYVTRGLGDADRSDGWVILGNQPLINNADMLGAEAHRSSYGGDNYQIDFSLTRDAAARFHDWTSANIGSRLAIVVNDLCKSTPVIQSAISDRGEITGAFTKSQANDLAIALGSGALPPDLHFVGEEPAAPGK